ncbi:MAG: hypothetical protein HY848_04650 [Betaproteobacteria bacterium]|nr:hypothetical protein [Betaproteobacteria bacterium]
MALGGSTTQFDYFYSALAKRYPGIADANGTTTNFQFMNTPMQAQWITGGDANAFELANSTSVGLDGFFIPGGGFANAYRDLVLSIDPTQGSDNARYRNCVIQIAALDNQIQSLTSQAQGSYKVFVANNPGTQETFTQWLLDPFGGLNFRQQLDELQARRGDFASTQANVLKALDGPLALAQAAVSPWAQTMNISEGGATQAVPLTTIGGDLAGDVGRWTARPAGQYDFDVTITGSDTITSPWRTTYTTVVHSDCWGTSASVEVNTSRIISDSQYKLRICAVGMNSYKINRGQWFDDTLVSPQTKIVEGSAWTPDMFFGLNGSLHLVPDVIFVMFRPMIKLTTSTQVFKQQIQANADAAISYLDLMGFRFNVDGMASLQPEGDAVTTTVTFNAPDNQQAQIVGITSKVAWNGDEQ